MSKTDLTDSSATDATVVGATAMDDGPEPQAKRPLWRRILKWSLWTIAILLLLVVGTLIFFHTPPGVEIVRSTVEDTLGERFKGSVKVGEIDYLLFFGDIELRDLHIAEPSAQGGADIVHLKSLTISPDWGSLLSSPVIDRVALSGLDLRLKAFDDGTTNLDRVKRPAAPLKLGGGDIAVRSLEIDGVSVHIERADGSITKLDDLTIKGSLAATADPKTAKVEIDLFSLQLTAIKPGAPTITVPLSTGFTLASQGKDFQLATKAIITEAVLVQEGAPTRKLPVKVGALTVRGGRQKIVLALAGVEAEVISLKGIDATVQLGEDGLPKGTQHFALTGLKASYKSLNRFLGQDVLASDIDVDVEVDGPMNALVLEGDVATEGGDFKLTGTADVSAPPAIVYDLRFEGSNISTAKLLANDTLNLKTSMVGTFKGEGLDPETRKVAFKITVGKTTADGRPPIDGVEISGAAQGQTVRLDGVTVRAFGQSVTLNGQLSQRDGLIEGRLTTKTQLDEAITGARDAGVMIGPLPPVKGKLDVDLGFKAKLKPGAADALAANAGDAKPDVFDLETLPMEWLKLDGFIRGEQISANGNDVGELDLTIDAGFDGKGPTGRVDFRVRDVVAGGQTIDAADIGLTFSGGEETVTIRVRDKRQRLAVDATAIVIPDIKARSVDAHLTKLEVTRGAFSTRLLQPISVTLEQPAEDGSEQSFRLPETRLALAGGQLVMAASARLVRNNEHPEATTITAMNLDLGWEGLSLQRLAALGGRSAKGLRGHLSGDLEVSGTPDDPNVNFNMVIKAAAAKADPVTIRSTGSISDLKLKTHTTIRDDRRSATVAELRVEAPLRLGDKPGLKPGGSLLLSAEVPPQRLSDLASLIPGGLPPKIDPNTELSASMAIQGTPARPRGQWSLDVESGAMRARGLDDAPQRQRLSTSGSLGRDGRTTTLQTTTRIWLDVTKPALVDTTVAARFDRSPLLRGALRKPWTMEITQAPIDLSQLKMLPGGVEAAGFLSNTIAIEGKGGDDIALDLAGALQGLQLPGQPAIDVAYGVVVDDEATTIRQQVKVAGLPMLKVGGTVGVSGRGLLKKAKRKGAFDKAPIDLTLEVVAHQLDELRSIFPQIPKISGRARGQYLVGGTIAKPTVNGALVYDDFKTGSGEDGQVRLATRFEGAQATLGLLAGPTPVVAARGDISGLDLDYPVRATLTADLSKLKTHRQVSTEIACVAQDVDLMRLLPDYAAEGAQALKLKGVLVWDAKGAVAMELPEAAAETSGDRVEAAGEVPPNKPMPRLLAGSYFTGELRFADGELTLPGTERVWRDLSAALISDGEGLKVKIAAREADLQNDNRTLKIDVDVPVSIGQGGGDGAVISVGDVKMDVETRSWLVMGRALDGPEGELDMGLHVTARKLMEPIKDVTVAITGMVLNAPERFVRGHWQQFISHGDVIDLDGHTGASGTLPTLPPAPASQTPAGSETAESAPESGVDIHFTLEPAHVAVEAAELYLDGGLEIAMRGKDLQIKGRIDVDRGYLNAMGAHWDYQSGAIVAGGPLEALDVDLRFSVPVKDVAARDMALDSGNDGAASLRLQFNPVRGLKLDFGGVGGEGLLDSSAVLNTGRATYWSRADLPASANVQFGPVLQPLIATFVQTNLRNLIFMDRVNGWSEPIDFGEYGQINSFIGDRYVSGGSGRWRLQGMRPTLGQNRWQLGYDWVFSNTRRSVAGAGLFFGTEGKLGLGLFYEFQSKN